MTVSALSLLAQTRRYLTAATAEVRECIEALWPRRKGTQ